MGKVLTGFWVLLICGRFSLLLREEWPWILRARLREIIASWYGVTKSCFLIVMLSFQINLPSLKADSSRPEI